MIDTKRLEELAAAATPTPEGHPLAAEYVAWRDEDREYCASGTVHDARLLAAARTAIPELCDLVRELSRVASGATAHANQGECPEPGSPDDRDADCPACAVLLRADVAMRSEP